MRIVGDHPKIPLEMKIDWSRVVGVLPGKLTYNTDRARDEYTAILIFDTGHFVHACQSDLEDSNIFWEYSQLWYEDVWKRLDRREKEREHERRIQSTHSQ